MVADLKAQEPLDANTNSMYSDVDYSRNTLIITLPVAIPNSEIMM